MKLFLSLLFSISLFFTCISSDLVASRPATKNIVFDSILNEKIDKNITFLSDSTQKKVEILPEKPKKKGLGMIIGGAFLTLLGAILGIGLLVIFLLGFSIGSGFYFRDIYAIAGVMLGGLITFGVGIYMISRGVERWRAYKKYKKALRKMKKAQ